MVISCALAVVPILSKMNEAIRSVQFLILFAVTLVGLMLFAETVQAVPLRTSISLSGSDWKIHEDAAGDGVQQGFYDASTSAPGWIAAKAPGNIQDDVEAAHQIDPLWYGALDTKLYDVARRDWWYRKDFTLPASYHGRRITLDFYGVDEHCKVWLNGKLIGENGGMFRRFWFDVTAAALPGSVFARPAILRP